MTVYKTKKTVRKSSVCSDLLGDSLRDVFNEMDELFDKTDEMMKKMGSTVTEEEEEVTSEESVSHILESNGIKVEMKGTHLYITSKDLVDLHVAGTPIRMNFS